MMDFLVAPQCGAVGVTSYSPAADTGSGGRAALEWNVPRP
jgi:hypothetical protein